MHTGAVILPAPRNTLRLVSTERTDAVYQCVIKPIRKKDIFSQTDDRSVMYLVLTVARMLGLSMCTLIFISAMQSV